MEQAANLASAAAQREAEKAAKEVTKHVYILSGYAEHSRGLSADCKASSTDQHAKRQQLADPAEVQARASQDSKGTSSGSDKADQHSMLLRYNNSYK